MASFKIIRQIVFQQGDPESGGGLFAQVGEPCLQGRCDEDPFLREAAGEQPLLQRRGLPFPYEDGIIAAGGGVFPELAVELILFIPQFDHAGGDQDPLGLESGQHIQGAAEAGGVGVVGVVDDPAGQELEPVFDGLEHPYRVDEILERDAELQCDGDTAGDVLDIVQAEVVKRRDSPPAVIRKEVPAPSTWMSEAVTSLRPRP